jgi:hypothetical protein
MSDWGVANIRSFDREGKVRKPVVADCCKKSYRLYALTKKLIFSPADKKAYGSTTN